MPRGTRRGRGSCCARTPLRDVTVRGAATYLVRDETRRGVRAGRRARADGHGLRCLHAEGGGAAAGPATAGLVDRPRCSRRPRSVRSRRHVRRRLDERPLGRWVVCSGRDRAGLLFPAALLICDHSPESIGPSRDIDRRKRAGSSAARPRSSCHAGAARSAAPSRRRDRTPADRALERSSRQAGEDPAQPQRRGAVELARLRLSADPPQPATRQAQTTGSNTLTTRLIAPPYTPPTP